MDALNSSSPTPIDHLPPLEKTERSTSQNCLFIALFSALGATIGAAHGFVQGQIKHKAIGIGMAVGCAVSLLFLFLRSLTTTNEQEGDIPLPDVDPTQAEETPISTEKELQKPNEKLSDVVPAKPAGQPSTEEIKESSANNSSLHQFISSFVFLFLQPYLTGKVHAENDPKDRIPMIEQLSEALQKQGLNEHPAVIQELALKAYCFEAARGVYMMEGRTNDMSFEIMIQALTAALKIDFPTLNPTEEEITKWADEGLDAFEKYRTEAFKSVAEHLNDQKRAALPEGVI